MRINLDSGFLTDPRFTKLARLTGMSEDTVRLACIRVWFACYEARNPCMPAELLAIASNVADGIGFIEAMVMAGLAERRHGRSQKIHVCGVAGRITYLLSAADRGSIGGRARAIAERERRMKIRGAMSGNRNAQKTDEMPFQNRPTNPGSHFENRPPNLGSLERPADQPLASNSYVAKQTSLKVPDLDPDLDLNTSTLRVGKGSQKKPPDPRVKPVIDRWVEHYRKQMGDDYPGRYAAAGEAIRTLPASYTAEKLVDLVDRWWADPDDFILRKLGARVEAWVQRIGAQTAPKAPKAANGSHVVLPGPPIGRNIPPPIEDPADPDEVLAAVNEFMQRGTFQVKP